MSKPSDYFLSEADNAAIFEQQIRPVEFGDLASGRDVRGRPICIILAGQTGAGKSHTAPALAAALRKAYGGASLSSDQAAPLPYCHLVADTHKPYHPAYAGLVADAAAGKVPPGLASAATGRDARRWLAQACAVAATGTPSSPLPTLIESASRYPEDVVEMADIFRRAGYRVCIVLIAAHPAQSRLGLIARYLDAKTAEATAGQSPPAPSANSRGKKTLPIRLTPGQIHDESYAGLADLAARLDDNGTSGGDWLADHVLILRRGNRVSYSGHWTGAPAAWQPSVPAGGVYAALEAERTRRHAAGLAGEALAAEEKLFTSDVARLKAKYPERAAELDKLAAAYEEASPGAAKSMGSVKLGTLEILDADALVAHLRSDW